jgi:hypothetical protein
MECGVRLRTPGIDLDYWLRRWETSGLTRLTDGSASSRAALRAG